ncbi:uncharacterized protein LOC117580977 [Drosophila guanche]|uniref:Uncharacterized protein n=1 Tax=Drosophila guanche TaxID=7266 RepID=A0A3B0J8R9_DROGU|nr:uncharacterized protein LOC117580977 [Drosophila guanche]SPP78634.1 Hypothetical predicted protein [Drosophila guanche]
MPPKKRICRDHQLPLDDGPVPEYKRRPTYVQNQLRKIRQSSARVQPPAAEESVTTASPEVAEDIRKPVATQLSRKVLRQINCNTKMDPALSRLLAAADMTTEEIRAERINQTKKDRLKYLMGKVNAETPPPWHEATNIWYEIVQLENSIDEYKQKVAK